VNYLELITKLPVDFCHSRESGNPDVFMEIIFSFVVDSYSPVLFSIIAKPGRGIEDLQRGACPTAKKLWTKVHYTSF